MLDNMVEDIQGFGTLAALDSRPHQYFNVHIKWAYKRTPQRIRTKMMERVIVMQKGNEMVLSYKKKENDRIFRWNEKRTARIVWSGPSADCDGTTITIHEMAQDTGVGVRRSFAASLASTMVDSFKVRATIELLTPVVEVATECSKLV